MENNFYRISVYEKRGAITIETDIDFDVSNHLPLDNPLIKSNLFRVSGGTKFYDLIQFTYSFGHFAISEKLKKLLEDNHIKGWTCFPIIIEGFDEKYFVFQITSCAGKILNLEAVNNYTDKNVKFDLATWDGSGIFTLEDTFTEVCTRQVKELIEKAKITNIEFRTF